jgi:hypothetical protein
MEGDFHPLLIPLSQQISNRMGKTIFTRDTTGMTENKLVLDVRLAE